jgi:N-acyl-phosphatidylethanolamine-hydrolysing phospholipase D
MRLFLPSLLFALLGCASNRLEPAIHGLPLDDPGARLSVVWVGHATVLLRLGNRYVFTDPNLGGSIYIQQRVTATSLTPGQVPPCNITLISHPHLDHMDSWTMEHVAHLGEILYPAGAGIYLRGVRGAQHPIRPWESVERGPLRITAVPIVHTGGRYFFDTLWNHAAAGYVIEGFGRTVFFAGDTGYDKKKFLEIGKRFPAIDLALIPIAPARGGNLNHASPEEALRIFQEVGARYMIPIHYEAYHSTVVPIDEPRKVLEETAEKDGLTDRVFALRTGERWILPDDEGSRPWVTHESAKKLAKP